MEDESLLTANWAYRSYLNTAEQPLFGVGVFSFAFPSMNTLTGTFDMGGDLVLDLQGNIRLTENGCPVTVEIKGYGRAGTGTAGWEYDYYGFMAYQWPDGVNQVPSLVGTVIRAKPHNGAPAGVTASFIAVRLSSQ